MESELMESEVRRLMLQVRHIREDASSMVTAGARIKLHKGEQSRI